jgi:hypothetical protein
MDSKDPNSSEQKTVDSFIDSIKEEIRNEDLQKIWDKYGKIITVALAVFVAAVGAYSVWQKNDAVDREAISHKYSILQGLVSAEKFDTAIPQLRELANVSKREYSTLARLEYAATLRANDDKEAIAQYKQIAEDKAADKVLSDLAFIFYVNTCLDMMPESELLEKISEFVEKLKVLAKGDWKMLALEALAFCYLKDGKNELAKESLLELAKTPGIPPNMAERTKILINYIDS